MGRKSKVITDQDGIRWRECRKHGLFQLPRIGNRSRCPICDKIYQRRYATQRARMAVRENALNRMSRQSLYATCTTQAIQIIQTGTVNDLLRLKEPRILNQS